MDNIKAKINVKVLGSQKLFENKYVTVREDDTLWENDNGETANYKYTVITGSNSYVDVIVKDPDTKKFLMVCQYRYPVSKLSWEFPAGYINDGELPIDAAIRELEEETGLFALNITGYGRLYQLVGKGNIYGHVYYVDRYTQGKINFDPMENFVGLTTSWVTADEINEMILHGDIFDANTIGAWQMYQVHTNHREGK